MPRRYLVSIFQNLTIKSFDSNGWGWCRMPAVSYFLAPLQLYAGDILDNLMAAVPD